MAKAAPIPTRPPRPTRAEILEARRRRRLRFSLFASSVGWAFAVGLFLAVWVHDGHAFPTAFAVVALVPSVALGLASGRRSWPRFFVAGMVSVVFCVLNTAFAVLPAVCVTVVVLGYVGHLVACLAEDKAWGRPPPREADAPRGVGATSVSGGPKWKEKATVASSAKRGKEISRPRWF